MLRVFQLGSINCLVDSCLVQGDLGCPGNGAGAALTSPQFSVQGCSVETALEVASLHPAQLLGIEHKKGTLNYDSDAGTGNGHSTYWYGDNGVRASRVLEQSRGCCKHMLIPCFSGSCRETCYTWDLLWAFAPVVFPLDAGVFGKPFGVPPTSQLSRKQNCHCQDCTAVPSWGGKKPFPTELSSPQPAPATPF